MDELEERTKDAIEKVTEAAKDAAEEATEDVADAANVPTSVGAGTLDEVWKEISNLKSEVSSLATKNDRVEMDLATHSHPDNTIEIQNRLSELERKALEASNPTEMVQVEPEKKPEEERKDESHRRRHRFL